MRAINSLRIKILENLKKSTLFLVKIQVFSPEKVPFKDEIVMFSVWEIMNVNSFKRNFQVSIHNIITHTKPKKKINVFVSLSLYGGTYSI